MLESTRKWHSYSLCIKQSFVHTSSALAWAGAHVTAYAGVYALARTNRVSMLIFEMCLYCGYFFIAALWLTAIQKRVSLGSVCIFQLEVYAVSIKPLSCLSLPFYSIMYLSFLLKHDSHFYLGCFFPSNTPWKLAFLKSQPASSEPAHKSAPAINCRCNFVSATNCRRKLENLKIKHLPDL